MTTVTDMVTLSILICIKFLPDSNQLQADSSTGRPDLKRAKFRINTFDENAIEAGLQLAAQHGGRVIALSLCPQAPPRDVVLKALAMGVNKIYLVTDEDRIAGDTLRIATVLAAAIRAISCRESVPQWDILICGEASGDEFNEQVGPRLAVALGLPAVTCATRLTLKDRVLLADRAVEYCSETIEVNLPVVATVGMEINVARMPTVLQIMGAGRKPIVELELADLPDLDIEKLKASPSVETLEVFLPPTTRQQVVIKGDSPQEMVAELLRRLSESGEVNF
jgi:electron transfer flavoprotein beta subunit